MRQAKSEFSEFGLWKAATPHGSLNTTKTREPSSSRRPGPSENVPENLAILLHGNETLRSVTRLARRGPSKKISTGNLPRQPQCQTVTASGRALLATSILWVGTVGQKLSAGAPAPTERFKSVGNRVALAWHTCFDNPGP